MSKRIAALAVATVATAVGLGSPAKAQLFNGAPIELAVVYGGPDKVFSYPGNPTVFDTHNGVANADVNGGIYKFNGNTVTVSYGQGASFSGAFNGIRLRDFANNFADFTGVTLNSNIAGLTQADVSFDKDNIWINQADVSYLPGSSYNFTIQTAASAVPEPATYAAMIAGFGIAGAAMRRRRKSETLKFA